MIDIATWRARIGLYRVRAGPSGTRRAKVRSDGATDWLRLSTITVEQVVTVIITILLVLSGDIGRYYCLQMPAAASIIVNPGQQLVETAGEWY